MVSDARQKANQLNALKSTGPKTEEGKSVSRFNALSHGCAAQAEAPTADERDAFQQRLKAWNDLYVLNEPHQRWQLEQMVLASIRLDHCQKQIDHQERCDAQCAEHAWELDRALAAEDLAARLAKDPSRIALKLRQTKQGAEWLKQRWVVLKSELNSQGAWNETQQQLALDLLGVSAFDRSVHNQFEASTTADLQNIVEISIQSIEQILNSCLIVFDARARDLAAARMPLEESRQERRLKAYEARQWRIYWKMDALLAPCHVSRQGQTAAISTSAPAPVPSPPPPAPPIPAASESKPTPTPAPAPKPDPLPITLEEFPPSPLDRRICDILGLAREFPRAAEVEVLPIRTVKAPAPSEPNRQNGSRAAAGQSQRRKDRRKGMPKPR